MSPNFTSNEANQNCADRPRSCSCLKCEALAINIANRVSFRHGKAMHVVDTVSNGLCVFDDSRLVGKRHDIIEVLYTARTRDS